MVSAGEDGELREEVFQSSAQWEMWAGQLGGLGLTKSRVPMPVSSSGSRGRGAVWNKWKPTPEMAQGEERQWGVP